MSFQSWPLKVQQHIYLPSFSACSYTCTKRFQNPLCLPEATSLLGQRITVLLRCRRVWNRQSRALSLQERRTCQYYFPVECHTCRRCFINKSINKQHQITKRNEWWTLFPLSKEINKGQKYKLYIFQNPAGSWILTIWWCRAGLKASLSSMASTLRMLENS